jgi:hypothetical protein
MTNVSMWLVQSANNEWSPGIGDPTFAGWLTVFCYFGCAYLCRRALKKARSLGPNAHRLQQAWGVLGIAMVALGINKQLDLQSFFTVIARQNAFDNGWYDQRRVLQTWLIKIIVVVGAVGGGSLAWYMRKHLKHFGLAGAGAVFLGVFIVIRAASFHHVDIFIHSDALGMKMNNVLELSGIGCVALNARRFSRKQLRQKRQT